MTISAEQMQSWCRKLLGFADDAPCLPLEDYIEAIPKLTSLSDLPSGTTVLIRGDVDAKPGSAIGEGDIRLRSMVETLKFGQEKGWIQVIFGHIGRKPEGSLSKVADRIGQLLDCEVELIEDWVEDSDEGAQVKSEVKELIASANPGSIIVLENTRKYDVERVLWKVGDEDLAGCSGPLAHFANSIADAIGTVYIHEALSAGSLDSSSVVVPATMEKVALGSYLTGELEGPMIQCRNAELVIFSGLKIDKLDDLESIVSRGKVKKVIAAGSLAMALKKAKSVLDGDEISIGVSENPEHSDKPYYIEPSRIDQAKALLATGDEKGVEFVLPVDFVLSDGRIKEQLDAPDQQLDVGPQSSKLFAEKVTEFIAYHHEKVASGKGPAVAFHNGVFGMFEDPQFETGTKEFVAQLKRMHDAGVEVYVGGGEGGKALEKYGDESDVKHVFTAGGTVLNALGNDPIPYLQALYLAEKK
ncbi:Phosphoglycerate kinase [Planctomycetales bacterium 10988]|nr:Phosphoglycerate kinase [Planctomycetales bacterium 10988]